MKRVVTLLLLMMVSLALPTALYAQEEGAESAMGDEMSQEEMSQEEMRTSEYADPSEGWKDHRFHVAGYLGGLAGGTAVGLAENLFFRSQFEVDSGSLYGARVGWVFAPRFDLELEYGTSSPGLDAVLTDLQGQGKTVVPYADLEISYLMGVVNYSVIDRTRRIVPYLSLGIGMVRSDSSDNDSIGNTEGGIVYGAGVRVWLLEMLALRAEVRGMRSGLGTRQENTGDLPAVFVNDFNASFLLWSVGAEFRF